MSTTTTLTHMIYLPSEKTEYRIPQLISSTEEPTFVFTLAKLEMKFISEELEETERKRNDHVASVLENILGKVK